MDTASRGEDVTQSPDNRRVRSREKPPQLPLRPTAARCQWLGRVRRYVSQETTHWQPPWRVAEVVHWGSVGATPTVVVPEGRQWD